MVFDVLRGYLHVASGLSDVTKQRARDLAEMIVVQGMDVTSKSQEQVQTLTDELVESSRTNREMLIGLIRTEVDRTVSRMGFVREDELAAVREHVHRLEAQLQKEHQRAAGKATEVVMGTAGTSTSAARSAAGAASKTVSGVAGVVASSAAKMAGSASSAVKPVGTGGAGPTPSVPASEGSDLTTATSSDTSTVGPDSRSKAAGDSAGTPSFDEADALFGKRSSPKKASGKSRTKRTTKAEVPSKKAATKKAPAKKRTAKKAPSKKAAPKRATAKKGTPRTKSTPKKATTKKPEPTKSKSAGVDTRGSAENEAPSTKKSRGTGGNGNSR